MTRKVSGLVIVAVAAVAVLALMAATATRPAAASTASAKATISKLISRGTTSLTASGSPTSPSSVDQTHETSPAQLEVDEDVPNSGTSAARIPAAGVPTATGNGLAATGGELLTTFAGLNHAEQRSSGTGAYANSNFSLEPPDQALCVGAGHVLESVNTAIRSYTTSGTPETDPIALNQFFNLSPAIVRSSPAVYGDFTSDPKCLFDNGHFIVTMLQAGTISTNGDFDGTGHVEIAVSQTDNPAGAWNLFAIDTASDGGVCPCLGDQPLIGADANGFYVTTNSFPFFADGFNGAQVYAMSKSALEGGGPVNVVNVPVQAPAGFEGAPYSLQPAKTAPGSTDATSTEYFLSALDFNATLDNRIAVWKLTGSDTLGDATPNVSLTGTVLASEVYGQPPKAEQSSDGVFPLRDDLILGTGNPEALLYGVTFDKRQFHTELLDTNDDRMNEVIYAAGKLYGAVNTVIKTQNGPTRTGIAWFVVDPAGTPSVSNQGYLSVDGGNVMYPAFGVNSSGKGAMGVTIVGPDMHPSTAYALYDGTGFGPLRISKAGPVADDGFTGYLEVLKTRPSNKKGVARWGDYGATAVGSDGSIWLANETTASVRTVLANWATQVARIQP